MSRGSEKPHDQGSARRQAKGLMSQSEKDPRILAGRCFPYYHFLSLAVLVRRSPSSVDRKRIIDKVQHPISNATVQEATWHHCWC